MPFAVAPVIERPAFEIDAAGEAPGDRAAITVLATVIRDFDPLAALPALRCADSPQPNLLPFDDERVVIVQRIEKRQGLWRDIVHRTDIPKRTDLGAVPRYNIPENRRKLYGLQEENCVGCENHFG